MPCPSVFLSYTSAPSDARVVPQGIAVRNYFHLMIEKFAVAQTLHFNMK